MITKIIKVKWTNGGMESESQEKKGWILLSADSYKGEVNQVYFYKDSIDCGGADQWRE